jgi:hypothetical protein
MSQGPGTIEKRIAALFAATEDCALSVDAIADHAFELSGRPATRGQRLSATRAAHRLIRRMKDVRARHRQLINEAHREAEAMFGRDRPGYTEDENGFREFDKILEATAAWRQAKKLYSWEEQFGFWTRFVKTDRDTYRLESEEFWRATAKDRRIYFHRPDVPVSVWAVSIQPAGVIWAEAEVGKITERNVTVHYAGDVARLDRERLWRSWALWRGVIFVSSRTGHVAQRLDAIWQDRYGRAAGGVPPVMQMALAEAMALLRVPSDYTKEDIIAAFRREVKKAHPDAGGTAELFRRLVGARDRLLAALGTSAPAPKAPAYAPKGGAHHLSQCQAWLAMEAWLDEAAFAWLSVINGGDSRGTAAAAGLVRQK